MKKVIGSIYTYKELYPDFCVGDIVKRVNGKYIKQVKK